MSFQELSPGAAHARLARFRVVDVREPHEFHGPLGHVEGATLVPLSDVVARADVLAGSGALLLVCRSGKRSAQACERLRERGVRDVTNLAGGMIAWNQASLPVVRHEPRSVAALLDQIVCWLAQVAPLTLEASRQIVCQRLQSASGGGDEPSHAAVEELIGFVGDSLANVNPQDLDLSLAAFRRSLAVL